MQSSVEALPALSPSKHKMMPKGKYSQSKSSCSCDSAAPRIPTQANPASCTFMQSKNPSTTTTGPRNPDVFVTRCRLNSRYFLWNPCDEAGNKYLGSLSPTERPA